MQLCENGLAVIYFRFRDFFLLISVQCLEPEMQSAIDRSLPIPAHQCKARELTIFANSWIDFIKRLCQSFGLNPMSIACLQLEIDTNKD